MIQIPDVDPKLHRRGGYDDAVLTFREHTLGEFALGDRKGPVNWISVDAGIQKFFRKSLDFLPRIDEDEPFLAGVELSDDLRRIVEIPYPIDRKLCRSRRSRWPHHHAFTPTTALDPA